MIERKNITTPVTPNLQQSDRANSLEKVEGPRGFPNPVGEIFRANSGLALQPPELQLAKISRFGSSSFETRAIAGLSVIRNASAKSVLDTVAGVIAREKESVTQIGSEDAQEGLVVLNEFVANYALLLALQKTGLG